MRPMCHGRPRADSMLDGQLVAAVGASVLEHAKRSPIDQSLTVPSQLAHTKGGVDERDDRACMPSPSATVHCARSISHSRSLLSKQPLASRCESDSRLGSPAASLAVVEAHGSQRGTTLSLPSVSLVANRPFRSETPIKALVCGSEYTPPQLSI